MRRARGERPRKLPHRQIDEIGGRKPEILGSPGYHPEVRD